jgi:hypothetical protein
VLRIEEQPRPVYLKRDFGRLKKNEVYVRRGSSADPTTPALPDEIARMGSRLEQLGDVVVEFAHVQRKESCGAHLDLEAEHCAMPATIPALSEPSTPGYSPLLSGVATNSRYYRQLAAFEVARRLLRPLRFSIRNASEVAATSVRAEITLQADPQVVLEYISELPKAPKRHHDILSPSIHVPTARSPQPGDVHIAREGDKIRIAIDCGNLQPGRTVWSEIFYFGRKTSGHVSLTGRIFADNLPRPKEFELTLACNVKQTSMSVPELKALPDPR